MGGCFSSPSEVRGSQTIEDVIRELGEITTPNKLSVQKQFPEYTEKEVENLFHEYLGTKRRPSLSLTFSSAEEEEEEDFDGHYKKLPRNLGTGAFGEVSLGIATNTNPILENGTEVAMKKLHQFFKNAGLVKRMVRELKVLQALKDHPAIVQMLDLKTDVNDYNTFLELYVVMEKADGDLKGLLKNTKLWFTPLQVAVIIKQLFCGLKYMHSAKLVHRDIKPQNILYWEREDGEIIVKLCDFGLARCTVENECRRLPRDVEKTAKANGVTNEFNRRKYAFTNKPTEKVVTLHYRPPEVSTKIKVDRSLMPAIDVWSMGCVMGELLQMIDGNMNGPKRNVLIGVSSGEAFTPGGGYEDNGDSKKQAGRLEAVFRFRGKPSDDFIAQVRDKTAKKIVDTIMKKDFVGEELEKKFPASNDDSLDFLRRCLEYDPFHRLTVDEALEHPYLKHVQLPEPEDVYNREHEDVFFEFEDINLSDYELRCLLVNEIVKVKEQAV